MPDINFDFDLHLTNREMARVLDLVSDLREDITSPATVPLSADNPFNETVPGPDGKPATVDLSQFTISPKGYSEGWNEAIDHAQALILDNVETLAAAYHDGTLASVIAKAADDAKVIF